MNKLVNHLLMLRSYYDSELDQTSDLKEQAFWHDSIKSVDELIERHC